MAEDHLQLHGQLRSNDEESSGSRGCSGGGSWHELKKVIAQKNCQGKDLSSQLIQHSKLHAQLVTSLSWIDNKSFKQRHSFSLALLSCNFKGGVVFVAPFLFLTSPRSLPLAMSHSITSWCPLQDAHHSGVHRSLSSSVTSTRGSFSSHRTTDTWPHRQPNQRGVCPDLFSTLTLMSGCVRSTSIIST